ncbi:hypothetical protein [Nocardia sp. NBC_01730]|uniref:hypothetical protein n=1 Tax=Nocardia sp. NBC_01730 TaxID=2975998 RepID=UPI003FA357AF
MTQRPEWLSLPVLAALCDIFECTPAAGQGNPCTSAPCWDICAPIWTFPLEPPGHRRCASSSAKPLRR